MTTLSTVSILTSMQPSLFSAQNWTVSRLTFYIRTLLESDEILQDIWVSGEVSNLSRPASGHLYFTLKDAGASLRCVMWRTSAARLRVLLQDGGAVEVHGKIGLYEISGQYQLYVDDVRAIGEGALYQEFLRLKAMLEAEGLFAPERKRPIPELPRRIGVITSASGAAVRDILNTLRRRMPLAEVILSPCPVQGVEAPPRLIAALEALNRQGPDVILIARGGGSIEDLWAFNDEGLVRAVAASRAPVISGVGHETDFTLCDFAADLRAPTPTAAAELATQVTLGDLAAYVQDAARRLASAALDVLGGKDDELSTLMTRLRFSSPERRLRSERQRLDEFARRGLSAATHSLHLQAARLEGLGGRLESLNPLAVLSRGYAVVTRKQDGRVVSRVSQAAAEMNVRVSDGEFEVRKP
ncbi:MAG: exodeoxyribonuclease VII large subunit [Bacteroidota bacterium]